MKRILTNEKSRLTILILLLLIFSLIMISAGYKDIEGFAEKVFLEQDRENTIIPKPLSYQKGTGEFIITNNTAIYIKGKSSEETKELKKAAEFLKENLKATGYELKVIESEPVTKNSIYLTTIGSEEIQGNEGYKMTTTLDKVEIIAFKPEGVFRGIQTLRQLLPASIDSSEVISNAKWSIQASTIVDKPEYSYRGLMLDVARHFYTIEEVKRQVDIAAQYKINKVHLHLSDDQGWRLEIKKYPDLALIGGSTQVGGGPGGYYTQEEFKDLVKYASERYVEIVPEFDMPGHCNAALASLGFLNPDGVKKSLYTGIKVGFSTLMARNEKTYEFIDNVIREVSEISPSKYFHIGGDEADKTKKDDYDYFVGRVAKIAEKYGKIPIGWDPIDTSVEINSSVVLQNWESTNEEARRKQMKMIISIASKAYLDMKYDKNTPYGLDWAGFIPVDVAYNWDPVDFAPKNLVLGIEAPLWTETIEGQDQLDYMVYPRLLGYAEIGWTPKELRNWEEYKIRLNSQYERLSNQKVNFYKAQN